MEKYIPKNANKAPVKYMAVAAHQDDVEIMALDGIFKGQGADASFCAVVLADGAGCPKNGKYSTLKPQEIMDLRMEEQKAASEIGRYNSLYLLKQPSLKIKAADEDIKKQILSALLENSPLDVLYIHNLCDKHPTHIGAAKLALSAALALPKEKRPKKLFGCEVWRALDWLDDEEKVRFNLDGNKNLASKLLSVFESQNATKSYDDGARGRRLANATFSESHLENDAKEVWLAMDLTPLLDEKKPDIKDFLAKKLRKFQDDVLKNF